MKEVWQIMGLLLVTVFCSGCWFGGETKSRKIGLMSFGDLEGRKLPEKISGPTLKGKTTSLGYGDPYYLSDAVRDALKDSGCDTLVDVIVENETGSFLSNEIRVKGTGVDSKTLPQEKDDEQNTK